MVGVIIALLVLLPETLAAVRAARRQRLQISLNLAFGSAMASIGLTIPAISIASIWLPVPLHLGLSPMHIVLLALTCVVTVLTVVPVAPRYCKRVCTSRCSVRICSCRSVLSVCCNPCSL